ncbi:UNVERIFIED_ORG: hypothetical protein ABIC62_004407 [Burkholderia sp. 1595]|uniref:Uncharacterized protein n=1 Tax=Paraburkholderia terricola TaxID=169427 RepID=A0ABU1LWY4_9BURK|nr:hypothetical protein [Paraburkholderia terricola]MDR6483274.1 hypothetical protein [Paraburkholderia terricola]
MGRAPECARIIEATARETRAVAFVYAADSAANISLRK